MYFNILLVSVGLFSSTVLGLEQNYSEEQILRDITYLGSKAENLTYETEQIVNRFKNNFSSNVNQFQFKGKNFRSTLQPSSKNLCISVKNNFDLITSHIKEIINECYGRAQLSVETLLDQAVNIRKKIADHIALWTTNNTANGDNKFKIKLPLSTSDLSSTVNEEVKSRIKKLKESLVRFELLKNLKEMETNLTTRFCSTVAKAYSDSTVELLKAFKEC